MQNLDQARQLYHNFQFIDTHCHLDMLEDGWLEEIPQSQVTKVITISVEPDNFQAVLKLADSHEWVFGTQGVHPHEAKKWTTEIAQEVRDNIKHKKIVAIGEIGLDYHYMNSEKQQQQAAFEEQLQLAADSDLPVVIHTRDAEEDTKAILSQFKGKVRGVLHSFTSSWDLANFALDQGLSIGFNGILSFKKAENVRDVAQKVPLSQLLLETDSPFLTPMPYRGKKNSPAYLPLVAYALANIRDERPEELFPTIFANSQELFRI